MNAIAAPDAGTAAAPVPGVYVAGGASPGGTGVPLVDPSTVGRNAR